MSDRWVLFAAAVLLLRVGFALYLAGVSRSKNTVATLFRGIIEIAVAVLAYWAIGAAIQGSWREIGNPYRASALFVAAAFLVGPAVIGGVALERSRMVVGVAAALMMVGFVSPVAWKLLQWNWLARSGFVDEAGAIFIHFSAGVAALAVAMVLGPRIGKYNRDGSTNVILGHNLPLATMGILFMFVMWVPYVAGFADEGARAALNAVLAGAAGVVAASAYCSVCYGRQDVFLVYAGLLGGLVSVTAGADRLAPACAVAAGVVAGIIVPHVIVRLDLVWKIDDPGSGIAIHGLGGVWSEVAVAMLAPGTISQRAGRVWATAVALVIVGAMTLVVAGVVFGVLRATVGIRVREGDELEGLDLSEYDLNAYPDFQQTTIKSYHLREM